MLDNEIDFLHCLINRPFKLFYGGIMGNFQKRNLGFVICAVLFVLTLIMTPASFAGQKTGEQLYSELSAVAKGRGDIALFEKLNTESRKLDWAKTAEAEFTGNLRLLSAVNTDERNDKTTLHLIRTIKGELYILSIPTEATMEKGVKSYYAGLEKMLESKMTFKIKVQQGVINGVTYRFAQFAAAPAGLVFDKIFKISIVLMLFSVMAGMGMTMTLKDFSVIARKPRGIIIGTICQFVVMPVVAFGIGHMMGYVETYPFIYVGMILVTATPGGATSNLMTYFAKGDLALSISMTGLATVLSLFVTPLILFLFCSNIPDVQMPVKMVVITIFVLVLLPILCGMFIRNKWRNFAERATPFFSALGIISVLFIMIGGVLSNLEMFSNSAGKFGVSGFIVIFSLTMLGMVLGGIIPKMVVLSNYQARAISMEIGIRNVALGMTIALLIQDSMGDFNSYMFAVSGMFGLFMYVAGGVSMFFYKKLLPVEVIPTVQHEEKVPA